MNVLFLTLVSPESILSGGIYNDLMRTFSVNGHSVYIVCPSERRDKRRSSLEQYQNITILRVKSLNIQKTNMIEKGMSTLAIEYLFLFAINKYLKKVNFDLILYSTPPITFTLLIQRLKHLHNALSYLLLKDIFPQNAVDMGLIKEGSLLHSFFRSRERRLYQLSDHIGCMSEANVQYLLEHNPQVQANRVEVNPNSITPSNIELTNKEKQEIRHRHGIPDSAVLFVYGGNLGIPQGVEFLNDVIKRQKNNSELFVLIVGSGTKYKTLNDWFSSVKPPNAKLLQSLPKSAYDRLLQTADVGLIFLDRRFTIPNYPSRLLSYMEAKIPILMGIDINTDIGRIAEANGYGFWATNGDMDGFLHKMDLLVKNPSLRCRMGDAAHLYLLQNYTSQHSYERIMRHYTK